MSPLGPKENSRSGTDAVTVACYTPGTRIATQRGEVPVEDLRVGDRVITRDDGLQPVRWTGRKALTWHQLAANPHIRPILIRRGSLGNDLPEQDMMVSPNHRLLVTADRTPLRIDTPEALVAAKNLVDHRGIKPVQSLGTSYLHFMCDRHQAVLANGTWAESFQPGDQTLKAIGNAQRQEILELFPELKTETGRAHYAPVRPEAMQAEDLPLGR